jgi:hypothetical protein
MSNHYHLLIETVEPNLVMGMQWLQNTYTRRFNTRHRVWGRLFGDRYKAVLVEGTTGYYHETLLDYIHLNPVRAKFVRPRGGQSVLDYKWSSVAAGYALPAGKRAKWLAAEVVLGAFGCKDAVSGRRKWVERLDRRAVQEETEKCGLIPLPEEMDARCSHLRRGWYWGSQAFGEKMLKGVWRERCLNAIGIESIAGVWNAARTISPERSNCCWRGYRRPGLSWHNCGGFRGRTCVKWLSRAQSGRRR